MRAATIAQISLAALCVFAEDRSASAAASSSMKSGLPSAVSATAERHPAERPRIARAAAQRAPVGLHRWSRSSGSAV